MGVIIANDLKVPKEFLGDGSLNLPTLLIGKHRMSICFRPELRRYAKNAADPSYQQFIILDYPRIAEAEAITFRILVTTSRRHSIRLERSQENVF